MPTKKQVIKCLESVLEPSTTRNIVGLNLVREITVNNGNVEVTLASTGLIMGAQDWVKIKVKEAIENLPGVKQVTVEYSDIKAKDLNTVGCVLAVMSGKGGVGKSLISSLIAIALKRQGYEVGILDADITGPSIPKMFGINVVTSGNESAILPVLSTSGIEIMSINLILQNADDAVIWRGPLIGRAITQFWEEVLWGKLDYLIVDLPPGTADAPLTVMQSLPISGIIIVFTPQDLTAMVVRKAINMTRKMDKKILGVVENMSYLYVPEIDKKIELFGKSRGEEMAQIAGSPLLGQLPIDPELAKLCDEGNIELYNSEIYDSFIHNLDKVLQNNKK
jgi:Mrp family chromosome partitioning ATPase